MHFQEVTVGRTLLASLEHGESLRGELEALAAEAQLGSAWFVGWGAVQDADLSTFDQDAFEPETVSFAEPLELPLLVGTITRAPAPADDETTTPDPERTDPGYEVATRAALARPSGQALAGTLEDATVFGVEVTVQAFEEPLVRETDPATDMSRLSL